MQSLDKKILVEDAVSWRHHLHSIPELAYKEVQSSNFIAKKLTEFGLKVHRGLAGTGVVGTLKRGTSSRTIGLRADMDALPISEITGLDYSSRHEGVMHACGHDGHMAMLLAAARLLASDETLDGTIHFIFQPAEENEAGAKRMIEDGLFNLFPMDAVYGIHNWPDLPVGSAGVLSGAAMAAFAIFDIEVKGKGGHAAMPHKGADPVAAAFQIGSALQTIVSRTISPLSAAVVSITSINGGNTYNVIPESCKLSGTVRWFEAEVGNKIEENLRNITNSIAVGLGCEVNVDYQRRYPATVNSAKETLFAKSVIEKLDPKTELIPDLKPSMAAEDFAFMLEQCPGAYIWLGAERKGKNPGLHAPDFNFNDEIIPIGVELWCRLARAHLKSK